MDVWQEVWVESEPDEPISAISSQSNNSAHRQIRQARVLNPYADLELPDGRRFQVAELRAYDAHLHRSPSWGQGNGCAELGTTGKAPRWEVEMEVQGDGRSDNFMFRVRIAWDAVRRGELERMGYGRRCDRPTAIFLLARECVWQHLQSHLYPPRFSSYQRAIELLVD